MKLPELALLYGAVGLGCALALGARRARARASWIDVVLVAGLWPLYGPFVLARFGQGASSSVGSREVAFLAALRRARSTPLAALLPDEQSVRTLGERLRVAADKVREIDLLLAGPEFCEREALARQRQLAATGGSSTTQTTIGFRLQNIRRLRRLRDRFARELEEIEELLRQLRTQVEVVRLVGVADHDASELVAELVSRVEGLDQMLDDDPAAPLPPFAERIDGVDVPGSGAGGPGAPRAAPAQGASAVQAHGLE